MTEASFIEAPPVWVRTYSGVIRDPMLPPWAMRQLVLRTQLLGGAGVVALDTPHEGRVRPLLTLMSRCIYEAHINRDHCVA